MKKYSTIMNGTGAAFYFSLGFVPDEVVIQNLEDSDEARLIWTRDMMRSADMVQGLLYSGTDVAAAAQTTTGIEPFYGATALTAAQQTSVVYGEGTYLGFDHFDYRRVNSTDNGIVGDAATADIDTWTLDTSGSQTGKFNSDVTGTYIGEGSRIKIDGREYTILALTAGQGSADDEVTLNQDAPSGNVEFISGKNGSKPIAVGKSAGQGFKCNSTSVLNVNDELISITAIQYDN